VRRFAASLMVLGLLSCTATLVQHGSALAQKEKDKDGLKDQWPKIADGTVVKILAVDAEKKTVEVEDGSGKKMSLSVTAETKFYGPQGGRSEEKIKDDRFVPGYIAKIITDKSGKNVTEVYLALRIKKDPKKDEKEEPKKAEEKKKEEKK
jgi:hypothetical protein